MTTLETPTAKVAELVIAELQNPDQARWLGSYVFIDSGSSSLFGEAPRSVVFTYNDQEFRPTMDDEWLDGLLSDAWTLASEGLDAVVAPSVQIDSRTGESLTNRGKLRRVHATTGHTNETEVDYPFFPAHAAWFYAEHNYRS